MPATEPESYDALREQRNIAAQTPVSRSFITLYTIANIGAYIGFIPLLQILVPLRAVSIDPAHGATLLSHVALWGAVAASAANILFGALSDRTGSDRGRRQPWIYGGLAAVLLSYAMVARSGGPVSLLASVITFQFAFNAMFAPLSAVLADYVPGKQNGLMAALLGMGYPLASVIGAEAVGRLATGEAARFATMGLLVAAFVLPFAWYIGTHPQIAGRRGAPLTKADTTSPLADPDFVRVVAGRMLIALAFSLVQGYLLLYLRRRVSVAGFFAGTPEHAFASLAALATVANIISALAGGWWSDHGGRRSHIVCGSGAVMAVGIAGVGLAPNWAAMCGAMVIYGCGAGVFYAVDLALIVDILPSRHNAGKDLGIVNLSNTVPQVAAPLVGLALIHGGIMDFHTLFLAAAISAALGAACVVGIKARPPLV